MNIIFIGEMDLIIINEYTVIFPPCISPALPPQACIVLLAYDDQIAEGIESFDVTVTASNPLDTISGNTSIDILDNDGMCV